MLRPRRWSLTLVLVVVAAFGQVPEAVADTRTQYYVNVPMVPGGAITGLVQNTSPVRVDDGWSFRPIGRSVTLLLDDEMVADGGTVRIGLYRGAERGWVYRCVPVRTEHVIGGLDPGAHTSVFLPATVTSSSCVGAKVGRFTMRGVHA